MMHPNHKIFQKSADKILDIFYDMRIADEDLMHLAVYTGAYAENKEVLDKIIEFGEHVKYERDRLTSTPSAGIMGA
jgi:hypothetical protein